MSLTTENFLTRAKQIHGTRYDYSNSKYVRYSSKLEIGCREHGSFWQTPNIHLRGGGCPTCGFIATANSKRSNIEEFMMAAHRVHDDKYSYNSVIYQNASTKVKIKCHTHGIFEQTPNNHLRGKGCPGCKAHNSSKRKTKTTREFINAAKVIHDDKYEYDLSEYRGAKYKIKIRCRNHGVFEQTANSHLSGIGCPQCGFISIGNSMRGTKESFVSRASQKHGDKYIYREVDYKNIDTKVKLICRKHGAFWQTPYTHLRGSGCSRCACGKNSQLATTFLKEVIAKTEIPVKEVRYAGAEMGERQIGRYSPDFVFRDKVIEVYGDYFHLHHRIKQTSNGNRSRKEQRTRDRKRMSFIRRNGFKTLVIWEREIRGNREKALMRAVLFLKGNVR